MPLYKDASGQLQEAPVQTKYAGFKVSQPTEFVKKHPRMVQLGMLAIKIGIKIAAAQLAVSLPAATLDALGYARKVNITNNNTTIIADSASREEIDIRVAQLKQELANTDSLYDTQKLSERIAKLAGGVAVIKVGAATETELEDRKLRIEDAKNATFAAIEEGIVPGGGAAFVHLSLMIDDFKETLEDPEERLGAEIVQKALLAPCRIIGNNAGVEGDVIVEKVMKSDWEMGYNAMSGEFINMIEGGVIDPKKVTRSGLMNSCSIAGMVLTTQAVITEIPKAPVKMNTGEAMADPNDPAAGTFSL